MAIGRKTLLAICRVSNLPTVWMNVLTAAVLAQGDPPALAVVLLMVALSASYCGGMVLNDYCDREIDAREQPFRPIPSGRVTEVEALRLATGLLGLGLGLAALSPHPAAVIPAGVLLAAIYAYDRWHKAHPASVLLMAATRTLVFVVTSCGLIGSVPAVVAFAGIASFFWTLAVTVVARHENQRGRRYGFPIIPWMIAGMALLDGLILAVFVAPGWLGVGVVAMLLTRVAQRYVRGD